jgi:hypothetical protein
VRSKVGERPSGRFWALVEEIKKQTTVEDYRKAHPDQAWWSDDTIRRNIKDVAYSSACNQLWNIVTEVSVDYITELDNQGLYIERSGGRIKPTSEKQANEQPPTKALQKTLARETVD